VATRAGTITAVDVAEDIERRLGDLFDLARFDEGRWNSVVSTQFSSVAGVIDSAAPSIANVTAALFQLLCPTTFNYIGDGCSVAAILPVAESEVPGQQYASWTVARTLQPLDGFRTPPTYDRGALRYAYWKLLFVALFLLVHSQTVHIQRGHEHTFTQGPAHRAHGRTVWNKNAFVGAFIFIATRALRLTYISARNHHIQNTPFF